MSEATIVGTFYRTHLDSSHFFNEFSGNSFPLASIQNGQIPQCGSDSRTEDKIIDKLASHEAVLKISPLIRSDWSTHISKDFRFICLSSLNKTCEH